VGHVPAAEQVEPFLLGRGRIEEPLRVLAPPGGVDLRLGPRPRLGQSDGVDRRLADQLEQPVLLPHHHRQRLVVVAEPDGHPRCQADRQVAARRPVRARPRLVEHGAAAVLDRGDKRRRDQQ